jgi:hypothetical protein
MRPVFTEPIDFRLAWIQIDWNECKHKYIVSYIAVTNLGGGEDYPCFFIKSCHPTVEIGIYSLSSFEHHFSSSKVYLSVWMLVRSSSEMVGLCLR